MTPHRFTVLAFFMALTAAVYAQDHDSTVTQNRTHLIAGATYNSGLNYYGRIDSLHSKAIYPFAGIALRGGLYANASFIFIDNSLGTTYAATLLEGGYNFKDRKGNWAGNLSATRFFYRPDIDLVQSAIKETASGTITHLNKVVNITIGANLKWSDEADLGGQAGLDHIVRLPHIFGQKDVIVLDPSANVYAGTQNFTTSYYETRQFLIFPVGEQQITASSRTFNVLAYEFSFPIVYGYRQLNILLTPSYVMPQHLLTVPGQPALSEYGSNLFYFTASMKFTL